MGRKAANLRKRASARKATAKAERQESENGQSARKEVATTPQADEATGQSGPIVQFLVDFPLISAALTVGLLLSLYRIYLLVVLRHPDLLTPLIRLRPALTAADERQLLIVATLGSGTAQLAETMSSTLGIEIGHETSDATQHFVRDGTVSWFHGIRFLKDDHPLNIEILCSNFKTYVGFHPSMYGPTQCSKKDKQAYKECYEAECQELLKQEKGCALHGNCPTPFRRTLHMARHPLRTIESLVMEFCRGSALNNVTAAPEFIFFMLSMYPHIPWLEQSCVEVMALYVTEYSNTLLASQRQPAGGKMEGFFRIEEATPCQVAQLAGFLSHSEGDSVVYAPNEAKIKRRCDDQTSKANKAFPEEKNQQNKDLVISLGWKDLRGGVYNSTRKDGDSEIEQKVRELTHQLGYDTIEEE